MGTLVLDMVTIFKHNMYSVGFFIGNIESRFLTIRLPFTVDILPSSVGWMLVGELVAMICSKEFYEKVENILRITLFPMFISYLAIANINSPVYFYNNDYGNYGLSLGSALFGGIVFVFVIFSFYKFFSNRKYEKMVSLFIWEGVHSLTLFPIHLIILYFVRRLSYSFNINNEFRWLFVMPIVIIFSMIITYYLDSAVEKCYGVIHRSTRG